LDMWPANVTGDSSDELLVVDSATVEPRDQSLLAIGSTAAFPAGTFGSHGTVAGATDSLHMWVSLKRSDSLFLYDLYNRIATFVTTGLDVDRATPGWDGGIGQVAVADLDADGRAEAIVRVGSGWDRAPRGLIALDWQTGREVGRFDCGPGPTAFTLSDINNDGRDEIVFGSWAPANGNDANGLSDSFTYAIALNDSLKPVWIQRLGHYSSEVVVAPGRRLRGSSSFLVACEVGNSVENRKSDSIWLLDPTDGRRLRGTSSGRFNTAFEMVDDERLGSLVVTAGTDDTIRAYDSSLKLVAKTRVTGLAKGIVDMRAGRFTGGRGQELAVSTGSSMIVIMDSRLRRLAEVGVGGTQLLRTARHGGHDRLLAGARMTPNWSLHEMRVVPFLNRGVTLGLVLPAFVLLLLVLATSMVYFRYRQTSDIRAVVRGLTGQAGIVDLDHRGRVRRSNPKARELLGGDTLPAGPLARMVTAALAEPAGSLPRELPVVLPDGKAVLARAARVRSGVMLTLEDISAVEYLKRVSAWVPVAQKLAHDIKNPLTAISLTLQRLEKTAGPDSQRNVDSMKDDIDRLKKMADGFMRLTKIEPPQLHPLEVNDVVRNAIGKFDAVLPEGIAVVVDLAVGLPPIGLDRDQMAVAFSNIIENSISAMDDAGTLTVSSSLSDDGNRIAVVFRDTGKGIPERYLGRVFEPYFTLKPGGTGLGLAITKRIVEDHKGAIALESKEGEGTTVTIVLPVAGTEGA